MADDRRIFRDMLKRAGTDKTQSIRQTEPSKTVTKESSDSYRRSIDAINRTRDRDIEKTLAEKNVASSS
jgi:hypothetical protein